MSDIWRLKVDSDGIGVLEYDLPDTEVNILTTASMEELKKVLQEIQARRDIHVLLICSAKKKIFIAGADIKEINGIASEEDAFRKAEQGKEVLYDLENLPMPTITVINGACLGGGYELALCTDYRVASFSSNVKIGLPEVNLGILPGFGGSIRMPRLLGLLKSLPLILAGKIVSAEEALKHGMVDFLFPEMSLLEEAKQLAKRALKEKKGRIRKKRKCNLMTWFLEKTPMGKALVFYQAKKDVLKRSKGSFMPPRSSK